MAVATFLVDTSANSRLDKPVVSDVLGPLLERGLCATCAVLNLEALFSAQSPEDYLRLQTLRNTVFEYLDTDERDLERAQEVQAELAANSHHRAVKLPDLIIAAVAERHRLTLLHYDSDFDIIAGVTEQPTQWVVERNSI